MYINRLNLSAPLRKPMYLPGTDDSPEKSTSSKPDDRYVYFFLTR